MHSRQTGTLTFFPLAAALAVALLFLSCNHDEDGLNRDFAPGDTDVACGNWTAYVEDVCNDIATGILIIDSLTAYSGSVQARGAAHSINNL